MNLDSKGKGKEKATVDVHDHADEGRWHPARDTDAWTATSVWRESRRRAQANKDSWDYSQYKRGSRLTIAHCSLEQRCSGRYSRLCSESSSPSLAFEHFHKHPYLRSRQRRLLHRWTESRYSSKRRMRSSGSMLVSIKGRFT